MRWRTTSGRVIPAWAGNTRHLTPRRRATPGHPRVGGEHPAVAVHGFVCSGSSPRGRGTQTAGSRSIVLDRVIPAWAGNTPASDMRPTGSVGHPRVGGEHSHDLNAELSQHGSSPRGRGTHGSVPACGRQERVIPAWAGNTICLCPCQLFPPGHPRVGGEHARVLIATGREVGSSPRGRGTRNKLLRASEAMRVIPAWAGNTGTALPRAESPSGHPRVGGEHACGPGVFVNSGGSSPRGRGTLGSNDLIATDRRVIPAWAGNTASRSTSTLLSPGHPRVGGEHENSAEEDDANTGSSPRGRGTPELQQDLAGDRRVIPAWAGNTSPWPRCHS